MARRHYHERVKQIETRQRRLIRPKRQRKRDDIRARREQAQRKARARKPIRRGGSKMQRPVIQRHNPTPNPIIGSGAMPISITAAAASATQRISAVLSGSPPEIGHAIFHNMWNVPEKEYYCLSYSTFGGDLSTKRHEGTRRKLGGHQALGIRN